MGNTLSSDQAAQARKKGRLRFGRNRAKTPAAAAVVTSGAADASSPHHHQQQPSQCPAQTLLEAIGLGIYTDAFLLAGYRSVSALAALSAADLAQVQAVSKVPILPHHQSLILAASQHLAQTLGTPPAASPCLDAAALRDEAAAGVATPGPAAGAQGTSLDAATTVAEAVGAAPPLPASFWDGCRDSSSHQHSDRVRLPAAAPGPCEPHAVPPPQQPVLQDTRKQQEQLRSQQGPDSGHGEAQPAEQSAAQQASQHRAASPCPLMNPFGNSSTGGTGGVGDATTQGPAVAAAGFGKVPGSSSSPSSFATARSASRGSSISGSDGNTRRPASSSGGSMGHRHAAAAAAASDAAAETAVSADQQQQQDAGSVAAATGWPISCRAAGGSTSAARDPGVGPAADGTAGAGCVVRAAGGGASAAESAGMPAAAAAAEGQAAALPGLSEIEPAETQYSGTASAQHGRAAPTPAAAAAAAADAGLGAAAAAAAAAAAGTGFTGPSPARHRSEPSLGEVLFGCAGSANAVSQDLGQLNTAAAPPPPAAAPAAVANDWWFQDLDDGSAGWDDSNPFLVDDMLPCQHSKGLAAGQGLLAGRQQPAAAVLDGGDGFYAGVWPEALETAAATAEAAAGKASAAAGGSTAAAAWAGCGGPLTSRRSQLLRPSSAFGGNPVLSSPAVTAAAAAWLAGRVKSSRVVSAWDKLPGEVASMAYARTASLKTQPLPALVAVASGQPRKQHALHAQPGVLTLSAQQLPHRPASEAGFSMRPRSGFGRHPGLRAEESAASAAAVLQELGRQQLRNEELIACLLHVPPAAPHSHGAHPAAGFSSGGAQGFEGETPGGAQGGGACTAEGSVLGSVLGPSTSYVLMQEQPQLYAQFSSSGGGSFLAPVTVAGLGAGSTAPQQQQHAQRLLMLGQHRGSLLPPQHAAAGEATVASGSLPPSQQQQPPAHQQQQVFWMAQGRDPQATAHAHALPPPQRQSSGLLIGYHAAAASAQQSPAFSRSASIPEASAGSLVRLSHLPVQHAGVERQGAGCYHLAPQGSCVDLPYSAAGAAVAVLSGARSCIKLGPRAADVGNIVLQAKARAGGRQQQLKLQQQQQQHQAVARSPQAHVSDNGFMRGPGSDQHPKGAAAMLAGRTLADPASTAAAVPAGVQPGRRAAASTAQVMIGANSPADASGTAGRTTGGLGGTGSPADAAAGVARGVSSLSAAPAPAAPSSGSGSLAAAAVLGGDRVLRMLQEYKELAQLDKAVKCRMMQLLHNIAAASTAPPGSRAALQGGGGGHARCTDGAAGAGGQAAPAAAAPAADAGAGAAGGEGSSGTLHSPAHGSAVLSAQQQQQQQQQQQLHSLGLSQGAEDSVAVQDAAQSSRRAGDQGPSILQAAAAVQHRDSPAKAAGQPQHSHDQQQKLAGLHRSPAAVKAAPTVLAGSYAAAPAAAAASVSADTAATDKPAAAGWGAQDIQAGKRTAARQLWQGHGRPAAAAARTPQRSAAVASAAVHAQLGKPAAGAATKRAAPAAAGLGPTAAQVLAAAGLPAGVQQGRKSSVAALVAAVAAGPAKHGPGL